MQSCFSLRRKHLREQRSVKRTFKYTAALDQRIGAWVALIVSPAFMIVAGFAFANEVKHGVGLLQILFLVIVLLVGYTVFSLAAKMLFERFVLDGDEVVFFTKFGQVAGTFPVGKSPLRAHRDSVGRVFYTIGEGDGEAYFSNKLSGHEELARTLDPSFVMPADIGD